MEDEKKAKSTFKLFLALTIFFVIICVLTEVFMPRGLKTASIVLEGGQTEEIDSFSELENGSKFIILGLEHFQILDSHTSEILQTISYKEDISALMTEKGELFQDSVFNNVVLHFIEGVGILLFDDDGDIFKFEKVGENYVLSNDYFLTDRIQLINAQGNMVLHKEKRTFRACVENDTELATVFISEDHQFNLFVFNYRNLKEGIKGSKVLYEVVELDKSQRLRYGNDAVIVTPIDSVLGSSVWNIREYKDYYLIFNSLGIVKVGKDFSDYQDVAFLEDVSNNFISALRDGIKNSDQIEKKEELGITDEKVDSFGIFSLKKAYEYISSDKGCINLELETARTYHRDWCVSLDPSSKTEKLVIYKSYIDDTKYNKVGAGNSFIVGGLTYSPTKKTIYCLNLRDNYLYSLNPEDLLHVKYGEKAPLDSLIQKLDKCSFEGKMFYETKGNISINKYSDCIFVSFFASDLIAIVDISDEPYISAIYAEEFDIRGSFAPSDGSRVITVYQAEKRTIKNDAFFPLEVKAYEPNKMIYRKWFQVFFIGSLVLILVCLVITLVAFFASKKQDTLIRVKIVKKDLRRNKWVYISLIPFVLGLILFCYVEAVGSISFSFFSYTLQKPSYKWNGFANFIEIFNNDKILLMIGNTAFFLIFDIFLGLVPPIIFAFCLTIIKNKKLSGILRALMFIPAIVPGIASLLIWRIGIFGDTGVLNQLVCLFKYGTMDTSVSGFQPISFLHDDANSRWSLILMGFPFVGGYLIFYGGLMNIPKEYYEACELQGVSLVKRFFTIDLPLIMPQIKYTFVMVVINSVQNYARTYMLNSTGTTTLVEEMYRQMHDRANYGLASAYATVIFFVLFAAIFANFKNQKKNALGDSL